MSFGGLSLMGLMYSLDSTRPEWSGDVDMGDETLKKQHDEYLEWIEVASHIGQTLSNHQQRRETLQDLNTVKK